MLLPAFGQTAALKHYGWMQMLSREHPGRTPTRAGWSSRYLYTPLPKQAHMYDTLDIITVQVLEVPWKSELLYPKIFFSISLCFWHSKHPLASLGQPPTSLPLWNDQDRTSQIHLPCPSSYHPTFLKVNDDFLSCPLTQVVSCLCANKKDTPHSTDIVSAPATDLGSTDNPEP